MKTTACLSKILFTFGTLFFASTSWSETPRETMEKIAFGNLPDIHTDAVLIIKDGKTVYERYARGYTAQTLHLSWSMGKSIAGMIAAQAIHSGKFGLNDSLHQWIPEYQGAATVLDAFHMSTGIKFKEEYSGIPIDSNSTHMLYLEGPAKGFASYVASLPNRTDAKPGDHFYYSSGDANLIMEVMKKSIHDQKKYDEFPWTSFFNRIGINDASFEQDSSGTFVGSSYLYMTARDYARIGQLMVNQGKWKQDQVIPQWYFNMMNEVAPGVMKNALPGTSATRSYSMQTTTNRPITGRSLPSEYPNLPEDALLMIGHQGQLVIASPSENLVIVRLATDKVDPFNPYRQVFFAAIRNFLEKEKSIKIHGAGDINGQASVASWPVIPKKPKGKNSLSDYLKLPHLMRALYAKELCSCHFVIHRTLEQCNADLKESLPLHPFASIDDEEKMVSATWSDLIKSRARYYGPQLGCSLL